MLSTKSTECRGQVAEYRMQGVGCLSIKSTECREQVAECRVHNLLEHEGYYVCAGWSMKTIY